MIKKHLERSITFVKEAWTELSKVHFSSPKETLQATLAVVILTFLMAVWLGLVDLAATRLVRQLLS